MVGINRQRADGQSFGRADASRAAGKRVGVVYLLLFSDFLFVYNYFSKNLAPFLI